MLIRWEGRQHPLSPLRHQHLHVRRIRCRALTDVRGKMPRTARRMRALPKLPGHRPFEDCQTVRSSGSLAGTKFPRLSRCGRKEDQGAKVCAGAGASRWVCGRPLRESRRRRFSECLLTSTTTTVGGRALAEGMTPLAIAAVVSLCAVAMLEATPHPRSLRNRSISSARPLPIP